MQLPKAYSPSEYESDIYAAWEAAGVFVPKDRGAGETFSIVLPPPNATGKLHVGHAAMLAIEDTVVRYQRMLGKEVLWVPGTDHAAIATWNYVIEAIRKERGIKNPRDELGREAIIDLIKKFIANSQDTIRSQVRAMGASVDWDSERYTMEDSMQRIVEKVFIKMADDDLIYRGDRIVNWDPNLKTTVADDELEYKEEVTKLYTFQYGPFQITTVRPETKFGDKYVVMHPDDKRFAKYEHGQEFEAEWINGKVTATVIKDDVIDPEFGTGVMTITPWHDIVDFDIAKRHKLEAEQIIDFDGNLLDIAGEFAGENIVAVRDKIVTKLSKKGLLVTEDDNYVHNLSINYRGGGVIEPQIKPQWFIDVNKPVMEWKGAKVSLKAVMRDVIESGDIEILPKRFEKTYYHWIDNLRDWNISRQIWWGHRIPAWFNSNDITDVHVGSKPPEEGEWYQDPDTLDTWFSSGLWSWSTLIEPEVALNEKYDLKKMLKHSERYKKFHPNDLMETGYDILFFWVARMILMTTYVTGEIPFKTIYLHGLVRTKDGSKMSKSKPETIINPLDMIEKYGTDALRLSLLVGQSPGADMRIFDEKVKGYRNFCNKLWNIARYVEGRLGDDYKSVDKPKLISQSDHWIVSSLEKTVTEVSRLLESYELGRAYELLYHFIWDDFADWYIEISKTDYNPEVLIFVLETILKTTHPFAPFVTEAIWDTLHVDDDSNLATVKWPKLDVSTGKEVAEFEKVKVIVTELRRLQSDLQLQETNLYHSGSDIITNYASLIKQLTGVNNVSEVADGQGLHLTHTKEDAWIDVEQNVLHGHLMQLIQRRKPVELAVEKLEGRLANKSYVNSAPSELVAETKEQMKEQQGLLKRLEKEILDIETTIQRY